MAPTIDLDLLHAKLILACRDTVPAHVYNATESQRPTALTEPWFKNDVKLKSEPSERVSAASSTHPTDLTCSSSGKEQNEGDDSWLWVCGDAHKKALEKVAAKRRRRDRGQKWRGRPTRSRRAEVADSDTEVEDELVARYVVLDSQTWELEEVESAEAARRRAKNPPVEVGGGVVLYVNDTMHQCLEYGLRCGVRNKREREYSFIEAGVPVNAGMVEVQNERAWSERKRLGIPDHVPVGSSLFYHVWVAVSGMREREVGRSGR